MADSVATVGGTRGNGQPTVIVNTSSGFWTSWFFRLLMVALIFSIMLNIGLFSAYREYFAALTPPTEKFRSGDTDASEKLLVIEASGTIMPPFTERLIQQIKKAGEDDSVKGVLLRVDSPGGLAADSHQIYHRLQQLRQKKPVFVQMGRMAASGGYYIAMGGGPEAKIFAEPITWTGSIGVILPRYNASELAKRVGVASDPLKTGEFKDTLTPFRDLTERERTLWDGILDQSFRQFIEVIDLNRDKLDEEAVRKLATGQIYTAKDAKENGLVDEIGYEEDSLAALKAKVGLARARVVEYQSPVGLWDVLLGQAKAQSSPWQEFVECTVPRAMFYCSWLPVLPQ